MRVRALALGAVAAAAQGGVVAPRQTLETEALLALQSSVRTLTATRHDNSFWGRAENEFSAKWSVSNPMALGETLTLAGAKADIYINTRIKCQELC